MLKAAFDKEADMNRSRWIEASAVVLALVLGLANAGKAQSSFKFVISSLEDERRFLAMAMAITEAARATEAQNSQSKATQAFDRLKTMAGRWEAQMADGKVQVDYQLLAGGSVLVAQERVPSFPEMMTVYHLDGDRLVLTHYCGAGNQPHMQAEPFDPASKELRFTFVSATNLTHPGAGHMHSAVFRFNGPDDVVEEWGWYQNGKVGFREPLNFHRVK
jgi:hypothetical protein